MCSLCVDAVVQAQYGVDMEEERTEEVNLFIAARYHASFGAGGGQALRFQLLPSMYYAALFLWPVSISVPCALMK